MVALKVPLITPVMCADETYWTNPDRSAWNAAWIRVESAPHYNGKHILHLKFVLRL